VYRALVIVVAACGAREVTPPPDYGPPPAPVDPIACAAERLEKFATKIGGTLAITTEPVLDAKRVDKVPCKQDETNDACIARARKRGVPVFYEVTGVTINTDATAVELTYDLDGRRFTEHGESLEQMVERLKAMQAAGHKVVVIRGGSSADGGTRHAAIAYRGVGGQERRVGKLTIHPDKEHPPRETAAAMADVQMAAAEDHMEIRTMQSADDASITVVATCGL